jgi:hypothetical protein
VCALPLDSFGAELAEEDVDRSRTIGGAICNERGLLDPVLP